MGGIGGVVVPDHMRDRPVLDGVAVPWTWEMVDGQARPSPRRMAEALCEHLCAECGGDLTVPMTFIGPPLDDGARLFPGPAHHPDCARYTLHTWEREGRAVLYHTTHYVAVQLGPDERAAYADPSNSVELL